MGAGYILNLVVPILELFVAEHMDNGGIPGSAVWRQTVRETV